MAPGERHSRLTFVRENGKTLAHKLIGVFRCDCGVEKDIVLADVRSGRTQSCGCLNRDNVVATFTKHGEAATGSKSAEYKVWEGLKNRCRKESGRDWENYGARGITVCERWGVFENFLADMGRRPSPEHSIDRINNDGNYEPGNCRWATDFQQQRNTRKNVFVEVGGKRVTLAEACGTGGSARYFKVYARIYKLGWPVDRALRP